MEKKSETEKGRPANTHEVLQTAGYNPSLQLQKRKVVSVSEQGKKYTLHLSGKEHSVVYDIDGYIIKDGSRCDKLILVDLSQANSNENWTEIFVELKGKDINHAIDQLRSTLKQHIFRHPANKIVKARIVAASFPSNKSNPVVAKAKIEFAKPPYGCELRCLKNGQTETMTAFFDLENDKEH